MDLLRSIKSYARGLKENSEKKKNKFTPKKGGSVLNQNGPVWLDEDSNVFPMPPPSVRMQEVAQFFNRMSHTDILEYCLGFDKPNAPALAEHVLLIALECDHLRQEPYYLLDIGAHTVKRKDAQSLIEEPGAHSLNILRNISYHHICVKDNARYVNRLGRASHSEFTRFGRTRYVEVSEIKEILEDLLHQPIDDILPDIKNSPAAAAYPAPGPRPIVILNADDSQQQLLARTFQTEPLVWENVVATINTRQIAREKALEWRGQDSSLRQLLNTFGIECPFGCSSSDSLAYALIAAVQMVMRPKMLLARETMRSVVNVVMLHSQCHVPEWGNELYCTCCGSEQHRRTRCVKLMVARGCYKCRKARRFGLEVGHVADMCPWD